MSKTKSPLKHEEGNALAHAPYMLAEDYHKAQGGVHNGVDYSEGNVVKTMDEEEKKLYEENLEKEKDTGMSALSEEEMSEHMMENLPEGIIKQNERRVKKEQDDKKRKEEQKRLEEKEAKIRAKEVENIMQSYVDSGEYSDDELNEIKRYQTRKAKENLNWLERSVVQDQYTDFGEYNVMRISEEMNISPHLLDIFKSENSNIYRVKDETGKISPKLLRIKDDGQIEFITSKELKDLDPNFYLKLNDDAEDEHYKSLDSIKKGVIRKYDEAFDNSIAGSTYLANGWDEDEAVSYLKDELEEYNIKVKVAGPGSDKITLIGPNGKEKTISLNFNVLKSAPGVIGKAFDSNSGAQIFNQIKNFVKEYGEQPEVVDHEENIIAKNIKAANEFSEEYDNSTGVIYNTIKDIETEISDAKGILDIYNAQTSEENKENLLKIEGYSTDLINVKDYAARNNIPGNYDEDEFISELELKTREDLRYGLNLDEWNIYNTDKESKDFFGPDHKVSLAEVTSAIEKLKVDDKEARFWQLGVEDTKELIDIDNKDVIAVLINLLKEAPNKKLVDQINQGNLSFTDKNDLLKEARAIVLDNYRTKKQVEVDQFDKKKDEFERKQLEFQNDLEIFEDRKSSLEEKINPIKEKIIASIDDVEIIDEKINSLIKDAKELEELAQTDKDARDLYNSIYNDYQSLLSEREKLVSQYNVDNGEFEAILNSNEYEELVKSSVDLQTRQNNLNPQADILNKEGTKLQNEFKEIYNEIGYDAVEGIFKDSYESVRRYKKWINSFADNPMMNSIGVFNEGVIDQALKAIAWIPEIGIWQNKKIFGDDPHKYSALDRLSGWMHDYIEENTFSPHTERVGGISETGWTYENVTRTFAEMLPFTLGIIHAARKANVKGIRNAYTRFTGGKLDDMAMKINITKRTYSLTIYDNYHEAKNLGLSDDQALQYATFMSSATAMSQLIMPDNKFLQGSAAINTFKSNLVNGIYGTTTLVAGKEILKNSFKNLVKELGEEEIELLFDDLNKMSFFAKHESMFLDAEAHADLAMGTIILSGGIQQVGNVQTFNAIKKRVRAEFKYRGLETLQLLQGDRDHVNMKLQRFKNLKNPPADKIAKLEQTLKELDAAMIHGRAEMDAINNAPSYASTEHIDLIVEKNKLINKKSSATGKELDEINKKIKDITAKIESTNAYERYIDEQKKDVERSKEIAKEEIGENTVVYESDSREEQTEVLETNLNEQSVMLEEEINDIKQDENGNAVNLQEQPALSKLKNEKARVDNDLANIASTEERQEQERELLIIKDQLDKIDPSGKLTHKAQLEFQLKRLNQQLGLGLISEFDFLAQQTQIKNALAELDAEIKADKNTKNLNLRTQGKGFDKFNVGDLVMKFITTQEQIEADQAYQGFKQNAFITPADASGRVSIIINKQGALQSGFINAGQHEILHATLKETLKNDPELQRALADAMMEFANDNPGKIKGGAEFNVRIRGYNESDQVWEEYLTLMAEAMVRGDVKFSNGFKGKVKDMTRRFFQKYGRPDIEFNTGEDVINFLRDYNKFFKSRKKNKAFSKMIKQGAKGKLLERKEKREKEVRYGSGFSKSLKFQFSKNPDLKDNFDKLTQNEDGTKRWNNKKDFQNSPEYWEGLTEILTNPQLESLIKEGIGGETGLKYEALDGFVDKVKVKLHRRYEGQTRVLKDADGNPILDEKGIARRERIYDENGNPKGGFDPSMANGSLFGWLIGGSGSYTESNLYFARGQVMEDYKKQIKTISADTEGTARKISQIPSDDDVKQETKNEVERNKIDLLKLPMVDRVSDKIKSKVKPVKGDGHKEIISKHAGEVGQLIFDIPGDKIVKGGANLAAVTKYEEGMPIPGEAQNIQRVFNAPEFAGKFIKTLPLYNIVERTGDIDLKGENLDVSRNAHGVAIGLKGLPMSYFYEDYIDPRSLSKDPEVRAESITSPKGRSKGLTSQTQVKKLKQEFINPTPETIEQFKRDIGITPKLEENEYSRDIGQLQKGVAKVLSMNVSLSAAQRNLEAKLNKAIKEGKSEKVIQAIKQQIANITGAQSKIAFSKGVTDEKNRIMFSESLPVEQLSNAEVLEQHDWRKIVKKSEQIYLDMRNYGHNTLMREWVINKLSKRLPKAFFYTSGTFDGAFDTERGKGKDKLEFVGYAYDSEGNRLTVPRTQLLNSTLEETKAMFPEGHVFGKDDADISKALTKPTQNKKNLEDIDGKLQRAIGFKKILNVLNQMIKEDKANIPYVTALLSSTSSQMSHFMRKGSALEFINTLNEKNVEEHTQAASDFGKFLLNRMIDGTFDKYIDIAMQAYFQGSLPLKFDNLLKDPAGEFSYKNNAGIYTKQILVEGKPVWIRYFNPDVNNNQGGINPNVLILANGNTIAQEYGVGVDKSLYNHDEVVSKQQELLFQIFNGDITQEVASETISKYSVAFSKITPSSEIKKEVTFSKAIDNARLINHNTPSRGMSAWDFDDTLATTKSGVRAIIPNPDGTPQPGRKVIFLAGGAGSGKSNVVKKLGLEKQGFKIVNSDISLEWLKKNSGLPENMNDLTKEQLSTLGKLQHQSRKIAKDKMMKYQGNAEGVVVDGTGGSIKAMTKLVNEFKDKGYDVSMVFVETSLETALERNKARKERSLLDVIVRKNHEAVQGNKDGFKEMFGERFMEVKTDNLTLEDAMPSSLTNKMNNFVSGYKKVRLDAEQFATQGAEI